VLFPATRQDASVVTTSASVHSLPAAPRIDLRLATALALVYVIWGSTYLAIRVAAVDLPPFGMAAARFVVAGGVMLGIAIRRGAAWPSARDWLRIVPVGVLFFVGGNGFVTLAEQPGGVSSGGAAVVCATMPLWVGVLGAFAGARPTLREWLALAIGFAGVVLLMGGPSLDGSTAQVALLVLSPIAWAAGSLLARRTKDIGGAHATLVGPALQMLVGGGGLAIAALVHGETIPAHVSTSSWLALAYLCVFGSLVGFTAFAWLIRNARPAVATSYAYVNPIVAVLLGAVLYGESLGASTVVANVLVALAVVIVLSRPRR
jgi:drug/metabolite transporter (DMT)-like permease